MNEADSRRPIGANVSLRQLLIVNALIAIVIATGLAYRKNRSLIQQREELLPCRVAFK